MTDTSNESRPGSAFDPVGILSDRFARAIREAIPGAPADFDAMITPSRQQKLGDFQCNAAMGLAKRIGAKPLDIATKIVAAVDVADIAEPVSEASIAGPGFINVTLKADALAELLGRLDGPTLGIDTPRAPETVVVDLCGVNLAKQMHVGHLRSTAIGDTLARVFDRLGHNVIRQNHVGDWGLQIAMVVWKLADQTATDTTPSLDLETIETLYREAQRETSAGRLGLKIAKARNHPKLIAEFEAEVEDSDAALAEAKAWLIKLQSGDARANKLWKYVAEVTKSACLANCAKLRTAIDAESWAGESSYREALGPLIEDLTARGIAVESDGALVVKVDEFGIREPCMIRKGDGGYLYATTDLAAIHHRVQTLEADRVVYCVDARQGLHFKQVFAAADKAGYTTRDGEKAALEHAAFGTILGEDGAPFKTRSGETVRLTDLLDEAVTRALSTVQEKNADLDATEAAEVAEAVGIAAIKYADLSSERIKDYVFDFDRMLAFEGNTGPYLLYALVRLGNIFKTAATRDIDTSSAMASAEITISEPEEKQLALALLRYPSALAATAEALEPYKLCTYAFDLATAFSSFYKACPVLKVEQPTLGSRLRLCDLTRRVLADALEALGLPTVERM